MPGHSRIGLNKLNIIVVCVILTGRMQKGITSIPITAPYFVPAVTGRVSTGALSGLGKRNL
jgi:hypothetical protein